MTGPDCRDCIYHVEDEDRKICTKKVKNWYGGDGCKFFADHYEKKEEPGND